MTVWATVVLVIVALGVLAAFVTEFSPSTGEHSGRDQPSLTSDDHCETLSVRLWQASARAAARPGRLALRVAADSRISTQQSGPKFVTSAC